MKNKLVIIGIIIILIVIVLIISLIPKSGVMICTYTNENDIYNIHTEYTINYKSNFVTTLITKEEFESIDKSMLEEYKVSLETIYSVYNKLDYYENKVEIKNNKLTSTTKINYEKLNIKEWTKLDENNKKLLKNNKVSLTKLKKIYKNNGAKCKYA